MLKTPLLKIRLLGPVEIRYQNQPVQINRRLERAILYYLAAENKPLSREKLIDIFWPNGESAHPRSALRTALSRLRSDLPNPDLMITELDQVQLDTTLCEVDLLLFEQQYQTLVNQLTIYPQNQTVPAQIVQQAEDALALWHGETIIQGDNLSSYSEIEAWRQILNQQLWQHRKTLLTRLANHYKAIGKPKLALSHLVKIAKSDPLEIQAHIEVIDILTGLERFQEASAYCDALEVVFEKELNAPLPEAVLERCQYSQMRLKDTVTGPANWPYPVTTQPQFVGRMQELAQLKQGYFQGGVLSLQGVMGSGKTRLVQELYQSLSPKPALFLAPAREMENSLPLAPFIHCFRQSVPEEIWLQLDPVWASQLALLLPDLWEVRTDLNKPSSSSWPRDQQQLFDAILHLLRTVASVRGRVLFFLDDAQWADNDTFQAIAYLVSEGFFNQDGVLILASRPEEPNHNLNKLMNQCHRARPVETVRLSGLTRAALSNLAEQILSEPPSEAFLEVLHEETGGNPFIAIEIIRALLETPGDLSGIMALRKLPLPENVHVLIRQRITHLDTRSRQVLSYAAVLGSSFKTSLLTKVAGLDQPDDVAVIDRLVKFRFLQFGQAAPPQEITLHFIHEKMREVILKDTSPSTLQGIHQQVACQLSTDTGAPSKAAMIANHYLSGGDVRNAYTWFLKAADHAWSLGSKENVVQNFEQAESLLKNTPAGFFSTDDMLRLYQQWIDFAYQSNQISMLETTGIKLQYWGERESNPVLTGISQTALASACFLRNEFETGEVFIQTAISYLEKSPHPIARVQAHIREGSIQWWLLNYDESLNSYQRALEIAQAQEQTPELQSHAFTARYMAGTTYYAQGNANKTIAMARDLMDEYYPYLSSFDHIRAFNLLSLGSLISADFTQTRQAALSALEITSVLKNTYIEETLLTTLSKAELAEGLLGEAYGHAREALDLGETARHTNTVVTANSIIGTIYFRLQNYAKALEYYRTAKVRDGITRHSLHGLENDIFMACLLTWVGQVGEAKSVLETPLRVTKETEMQQLHVEALLTSGICDVLEKSFPAAEQKFYTAEAIARDNGLQTDLLWSQLAQVRLLLAQRQLDRVESLVDEIIQESLKLNSVWAALFGFQFSKQLQTAQGNPNPRPEREKEFRTLIKTLEHQTPPESLRHDFQSAIKYWEEGYPIP